MKFTQNTPIVSPNTIGNVQVQAVRDPMAYGMGGRGYDAMAGALGQMAKVAKEQQDDMDAADHMSRRNAIMGNITKRLYGEDGLLTNGVGENAKGLTDRVSQVVQEEFERGLKGANNRVRRSMAGTFNENMGNFQRIAGQQEGREFKKVRDNDCAIGIENAQNSAMMNYQDMNLVESSLNDALQIADYNAKYNGFSGLQREQARRAVTSQIIGGAIGKAIEENDFTGANIMLGKYGSMMDQKEVMKYQKALRGEKQIADNQKDFDSLWKMCYRPDGTFDYEKWDSELERMANETKIVGGGGGDINTIDGLMSAISGQESNNNYEAQNGRTSAYGKYQILPGNWPSWSKEAGLGENAERSPENQEKVARFKLNQYLQKYGAEGAMVAWYSGPGNAERWVAGKDTDVWGRSWDAKNGDNNDEPSIREYVQQVSARGSKGGGVSFEKLDDDINASGVDLTGTKPRTIGMINYAHKLYKELTGLDDFWVSCTTGGHAADTAHGRGDGADVGGSGLKDPKILEKFLAGMRAAGAGANDEYNYKSKGWTGPHVDLKADGDNWQTGEKFGGFKGGSGSGGHAVNIRRSDFKDTMNKMLRARLQEVKVRENARNESLLKGYEDTLKNCTGEEAVAIVERAKQKESASVAGSVSRLAAFYHKDVFTQQGTRRQGGASRGSSTGEKIHGENGYYGKSGAWVSMKQYNEDQETIRLYNEHKERQEQGLYRITDEEQSRAMKAARRSNDVWDNNFEDIGIDAAAKAFSEAKGNSYEASVILQKQGMSQDEAWRYLNKWLSYQKSDDEE